MNIDLGTHRAQGSGAKQTKESPEEVKFFSRPSYCFSDTERHPRQIECMTRLLSSRICFKLAAAFLLYFCGVRPNKRDDVPYLYERLGSHRDARDC